uniref:Core-2/I-Branching enzyme n=1 Tax=Parascaris univalens TaxID=6257 RepID=A0A915CFS1_PARUN
MQYGVDEMTFPSIHSDDQLDAPGGFTQHCIGKYNNLITRYVSWQRSLSASRRPCYSRRYRHEICIFGLADLSTLSSSKSLFANKMLP